MSELFNYAPTQPKIYSGPSTPCFDFDSESTILTSLATTKTDLENYYNTQVGMGIPSSTVCAEIDTLITNGIASWNSIIAGAQQLYLQDGTTLNPFCTFGDLNSGKMFGLDASGIAVTWLRINYQVPDPATLYIYGTDRQQTYALAAPNPPDIVEEFPILVGPGFYVSYVFNDNVCVGAACLSIGNLTFANPVIAITTLNEGAVREYWTPSQCSIGPPAFPPFLPPTPNWPNITPAPAPATPSIPSGQPPNQVLGIASNYTVFSNFGYKG